MNFNFTNQIVHFFRSRFFICVVFLMFGASQVDAQTIVTVVDGDAVGTNCAIINETTSTQWSLYQHIYPKSLINAAGTISSLQFEHNAIATTPTNNSVDIYLGEINKSTFSSATDWINSNLSLVYTGTLKAPNNISGFYTVNLTTTFNYTNTNNLVLVIHRRGSITSSNAVSFHYYGTATNNSSLAIVSAATVGSYGTWAGTGSFACGSTLPSLKLGFSVCSQPTDGGNIGYSQGFCGASFNPSIITNVRSATNCSPIYKWQISTDGTTWTDISPAVTSESYDPPVLSQSTFYRRLAQVSGQANWVPSNIVKMTLTNAIAITQHPSNDTVYQQVGTGVFFARTNITGSVTYQWQVSTNNGANWSNVPNSAPYSGVTDSALNITNPTYSYNLYQYRCVINSASCGSITTNGGILYVLANLSATSSITMACGSWDGSIDIPITVSNIGVLNTTTNTLRQINLILGSSSCKRSMSTYDFTLIAPNGTTSLKFIDNFTTTGSSIWVNIKFRDHPALEKISQYNVTQQGYYFPYSYGYYAVEQDGSLVSSFNNIDANGTWTLRIEETSGSTGISIGNATLLFGPDFNEIDVTGSTINNFCATATCMGADNNIIIGTNNTYTPNDLNLPDFLAPYPTDCIDQQCDWNAANNNSAWYYFFATSSTARITVSGNTNVTPGSVDMQLIVVDGGTGCQSGLSWGNVPPGGCLDDETSGCWTPINNSDYYVSNGGGVGSGNVYANGISFNTEFNLSGLVVGRKYFLIIDGNGGLTSTYYIEMESGAANCIFGGLLPVKFYSFNAAKYGSKNQLIWKTSQEINNDYFQVERSSDGRNWSVLQSIQGAGRESRTLRSYEVFDAAPLIGANYYRIKQVSSDDSYTYSEVRKIMNDGMQSISIYPNPGKGNFVLSGLQKGISHQIQLIDISGKRIKSFNTTNDVLQIPMHDAAPGVYYIRVDGKSNLKFVNME